MRFSVLVVFVILIFPGTLHAAVLINEIAWMGNAVSANDEWIELYNSGENSVDLGGWTLSDGVSLEIPLSGTVAGGAYAVLERTDDSSAQGTAFLIYTGALANDGRTLVLKRANGGVEDQVAGGENWESIGGDNLTKDTPQRTPGGWITGAPTPGAYNSQTPSEEENEPDSSAGTSKPKKEDDEEVVRISLTVPNSALTLRTNAPKTGYVNQPITFKAVASGLGPSLINSLAYTWSFGDGESEGGKEVTHTYAYPGTYVVVLQGIYGKHEAIIRQEITVLPTAFELSRAANGDVYLHNNAKYEVDAGGFTVRGTKSYTFPKYTIVLPAATITIPAEQIGGVGSLQLFDTLGKLVATHDPYEERRYEEVIEQDLLEEVPFIVQTEEDEIEESSAEVETSPEAIESQPSVFIAPEIPMVLRPESQQGNVIEASAAIPKEKLPYVAIIGVLALGVLGVFTKRKN